MPFRKQNLGVFQTRIIQSELKYYRGLARLCLFLDVTDDIAQKTSKIVDSKGVGIPLTDGFKKNGFKTEAKSIKEMSFTSPVKIAGRNALPFVHPFILGNETTRGTTDQSQYLASFFNQNEHLGLNIPEKISSDQIGNLNDICHNALKNKMLESAWARWFTEEGYCFTGPDGDSMIILN